MADNILKKQLDCISEDFLRGVYAEATKPMRWVARAKELPVVTMKDLG